MITAYVNEEAFRDDACALLRAFYPGETVVTELSSSEFSKALSVRIIRDGDETGQLEVSIDNRSNYTKTGLRNEYKRRLYQCLSAKTGRTLPWGALTGVRPTRLAWRELERGKDPGEASEILQRSFFVSAGKADLAVRIAMRERRILSRFPFGRGYSVYIGIPFCPSRCFYCSFSSYPIDGMRDMEEAYLTALFKEIEFAAAAFPERILNTVYIGGGTPTALSARSLDRLLDYVNQTLHAGKTEEFTVEAGRPDS
ncbi:MAG: coproporphyrinogen dehydrogenase HemZ, partial [Lachnospiraceae bacterium]|nr:coproporphyrinogen dehydrogenase HemZ [Lachnospiraceae bacterium]